MQARRGRTCVFVLRRAVFVCAAAAVLASSPAAFAQATPAGSLQGRVLDTTGLPLPAVLVEVESTGTPLVARTGADGRYLVDPVPGGSYTVRFSLPSFVTMLRRNVTVTAGSSTIQDATLYVAATASVVVSGRTTFRNLSTISEQDELVGVAETASTGVVTPAELNERARRRPAEALETVPGLVVSQHSGEGKANQYYLRGFNIDHGTDLALSVAGMPVNQPTHAHGQGYADMNFLIPELVSGIQYRKGTYAADTGDFSAAGSVRVNYLNVLDNPIVRVEGGGYGYGRVLAAASPKVGNGQLLVAAEAMGNDGPWDRPDAMRRWNGLVRYSQGGAASGLSVTGLFYSADWNSSDQIPKRAVDDGSLDRFGYVDRTNGGNTHRFGGIVEWQRTTATGATHVEGYGFDYGLDLFSNFTYFLDDPENGDQFEQFDDRFVFGGRASHGWSTSLFGRRSVVTVGGEMRRDDIGAVGLYRTTGRSRLSTVREDTVGQTSGGAYAEVQTQWSNAVRTTIGVRGDLYNWKVDADDPVNGGKKSDGIVNPKFRIAFGTMAAHRALRECGRRVSQQRRSRRHDPARPCQRRRGRAGGPARACPRGRGRPADTRAAAIAYHVRDVGAVARLGASLHRRCRDDRGEPAEPAAWIRVGRRLSRDAVAGSRRQRRVLAGAIHRRSAGRRSHPRGDRGRGQRRDANRSARPLERQPPLAVLRTTAAHRRRQRAQSQLKPRQRRGRVSAEPDLAREGGSAEPVRFEELRHRLLLHVTAPG